MRTNRNTQSGYLVILTLVFGAIFLVMVVAFMSYITNQYTIQQIRAHEERAFAIAESGLHYYKWYLAHFPDDLTNGTGEDGPYEVPYEDTESGLVGTSTLSIAANTSCGDITSVDIVSTGATREAPDITRTLSARYTQPTVATYAYIINANVWAGEDRTIVGPYHSNGVIRMDGTNNSIVSSGQASWECDGSLPCDPHDEGDTVDAVYGDGGDSNLWVFPQPPINFTSISVDLATIADRAENDGGIYLGPSGDYGYRVRFNSDDTISVYVVDRTEQYYSYSSRDGWQYERNVITDDDFVGTYSIPSACSVIFVEDKVWLEGTLSSKVTLAAADIDSAGVDPSIVLNDNITYANENAGLLAIAEDNVLVGLLVPEDMNVSGIFAAQNGRFGRNYYDTWDLPHYLDEYVERGTLTVYGSIISNRRVGTQWVSLSTGAMLSGFANRVNIYDRDLANDPPPYTPATTETFEFTDWREE